MKNDNRSPLLDELHQLRPFRSKRQEAAIAILRTADDVRRRLTESVETRGLTLQQYNVLRILRGAHPQPLPTLAIGERLIERTPGVTRLLDRLESKALVQRERSEDDRRLVYCSITEAGLQLLAEMDERVDQADEDAAGSLTEEESIELLRLLARVRHVPRDDKQL